MVGWRGSLISLVTSTVKPGHYKHNTVTQNVQPIAKLLWLQMPNKLFQFSPAEKLSFSFFFLQKQNPKIKNQGGTRRHLQVLAILKWYSMKFWFFFFFLIHLVDACACGRLQDSDNLIHETRKKSDERFPWQVFPAIHETYRLPPHAQCCLPSFCIFLGTTAELRRERLLRRSVAKK